MMMNVHRVTSFALPARIVAWLVVCLSLLVSRHVFAQDIYDVQRNHGVELQAWVGQQPTAGEKRKEMPDRVWYNRKWNVIACWLMALQDS